MATRSGATYHTAGPTGLISIAPSVPGATPAASALRELGDNASERDAPSQEGDGGAGDPARADPRLDANLDQFPPLEDDNDDQFTTVNRRRLKNSPIVNSEDIQPAHESSPGREFSATGPLLFPDWFGDNQESVNEDREEDTRNLIDIEDDTIGRELYSPGESPRIPELGIPEDDLVQNILDGLSPMVREAFLKRMGVNIEPYELGKSSLLTTNSSHPYPSSIVKVSSSERKDSPIPLTSESISSPSVHHVRFSTAQKGKFRATSPAPPHGNTGIYIAPDPESREGQEAALREHDRRVALEMQEREDLEAAKALSAAERLTNANTTNLPEPNPRSKPRPSIWIEDPSDSESEGLPSPKRAGYSATKGQRVLKEGSAKPHSIPIRTTPSVVAPSNQIPSGSLLFKEVNRSSKRSGERNIVNIKDVPVETRSRPDAFTRTGSYPKKRRSSARPLADNPDPSDPSSTSSSLSSSSDSDTSTAGSDDSDRTRRRKNRKKKIQRKRAKASKLATAMKLEAPKKWDGNSNIDLFEEWLFSINQYYKILHVPDDLKVSMLTNFLEGRARKTFMSIIAPTMDNWSIDEIAKLFLDELFPSNIRQILRKRFENSYQGGLTVKAWAQRVRDLSARINDVSPEAIARQFWRGAKPYLRVQWSGFGYSEEFSTFEELIESGTRFERQEQQQRTERSATDRTELRSAFVRPSGKSERKGDRNRDRKQDDTKGNRSRQKKSPANDRFKRQKQSKPKEGPNRDELRAANKCFECYEVGHLARDCPSKNTAKPPTFSSHAINFSALESQARNVTNLSSCSVLLFPIERPSQALLEARAKAISNWTMRELEERLNGENPFPEWIEAFEGRFDVSSASPYNDLYKITDRALNIELVISSDDLFKEDLDVVELVRTAIVEIADEWKDLQPSDLGELALPDVINDQTFDRIPDLKTVTSSESSEDDMPHLTDPYSSEFEWESDSGESGEASTKASAEPGLRRNFSCETISDESDDGDRDKYISNWKEDSPIVEEVSISSYAIDTVDKSSSSKATINRRRKANDNAGKHSILERNAARPKDFERMVPKTCVIDAFVNNQAVRVLIDTGSMSDFVSTTLVDQLKLKTEPLMKPLTVQLAVTGSRGKIHSSATVDFRYEEIDEKRRFDVMNIDGYDAILGTPFLFQHKGIVGFNPTRFAYEDKECAPFEGAEIARIQSMAATMLDENLEKVRELLRKEAADLCKSAEETALPPFRAISHRIPLKDESLVLPYVPSRCPEAFRQQWEVKRDAYLKTGRWKYATGTSSVPMLYIPKKPGPNGEKRLRTASVFWVPAPEISGDS
jgi:hypothetical protein